MGAGDGYFDDPSEASELPKPVRTVRVLLFITAAITVLIIIGALLVGGFSAEILGALIWAAWPGILGFAVALKIKRPSRQKFWVIIVAAAALIFNAFGLVGQGDPRGLTALILPVLTLVFVLRGSSRRYFLRTAEE